MRFSILFLLFITSSIFGQNKYDKHKELIVEASQLMKNENYEGAIKNYEKAFEYAKSDFAVHYYRLAECGIKINDTILADKWIRKGISEGNGKIDYLKKYEGFKNVHTNKFFEKIILDYNDLRKEYISDIDNVDLYLEINEMIANDQLVRKIDDIFEGRSENYTSEIFDKLTKAQEKKDTVEVKRLKKLLFPKPNEKYKEIQRELMIKVDSLNINRLIEITKEHGWQKQGWIILWHQRGTYGKQNYVWDYFKPAIDKEIQEGKIGAYFWDMFEQDKMRRESRKMKSNNKKIIKN